MQWEGANFNNHATDLDETWNLQQLPEDHLLGQTAFLLDDVGGFRE